MWLNTSIGGTGVVWEPVDLRQRKVQNSSGKIKRPNLRAGASRD